MCKGLYTTVYYFRSCVEIFSTAKEKQELPLFPRTAPLEFVSVEIFGTLQMTKNSQQFALKTTDKFVKLTEAASATKMRETTFKNLPNNG